MHNFTLFSREIEWNLKCFHFFREMKSETNIPFTLFEKWKVKWFFVSLFSRSESEIEIPRDRDREVKFQNNSREFSRNETLAGYWRTPQKKAILLKKANRKWSIYFYFCVLILWSNRRSAIHRGRVWFSQVSVYFAIKMSNSSHKWRFSNPTLSDFVLLIKWHLPSWRSVWLFTHSLK